VPYNKRMQLAARGFRIAPVAVRRLGLRSARAARLRGEPPAGVRWVHGGRQLMRKPLASQELREANAVNRDPYWKLRPPEATPPEELCQCSGEPPLLLRSVLGFNPLACAACNREVPPEKISLPPELAEPLAFWGSFHDCFFRLWLDSREFEAWAAAELSDPASPVNRRGLALRERLEPVRRTYYWWFQDPGAESFRPLSECPRCSASLLVRGLVGLVCEECSILVANQGMAG
jgi:hypothetical protein